MHAFRARRRRRRKILAVLTAAVLAGTGALAVRARATAEPAPGDGRACTASWYGHGSRTASGERFDPGGLTAAHRTLPFGSLVQVRYQGRAVVVRINDRGPHVAGRDIDLARAAFERLAPTGSGVIRATCVTEASRGEPKPAPAMVPVRLPQTGDGSVP